MENNGGDTALEMVNDNTMSYRASSIETIEKTLYDISSMFKRFASIVAEH